MGKYETPKYPRRRSPPASILMKMDAQSDLCRVGFSISIVASKQAIDGVPLGAKTGISRAII